MVEKIASARNQMAASTTTNGFMIRFTRILRGIKARTIHRFHPLTPVIQAGDWNHFRGSIYLNLNGACLLPEPAGILAIQLAVLFVLSVAAIVYVNWSSDAALAEFMASGRPSATEPSHL